MLKAKQSQRDVVRQVSDTLVGPASELGSGKRLAFARDVGEALVFRNLPADGHRGMGHPAMFVERTRREPGPDDEAIGLWIARSHAQREGIGAEWCANRL
jgi:hypothetical protein